MSDAAKSNEDNIFVIRRKRPDACASCAGNEASDTQNMVAEIPRASREANPFNFYTREMWHAVMSHGYGYRFSVLKKAS